MLLKICYDFVITDEINICSFRHKLVLDQMTTKKVVKVVSFGLSPIGEKCPQTKEKPKNLQKVTKRTKKHFVSVVLINNSIFFNLWIVIVKYVISAP